MSGAVFITLGNGVSAGIDGDILVIEPAPNTAYIRMGRATKQRISNIQEYLERLKIHCPE